MNCAYGKNDLLYKGLENMRFTRAISSVGRAALLHSEGRRFESCIAHKFLSSVGKPVLAKPRHQAGFFEYESASADASHNSLSPQSLRERTRIEQRFYTAKVAGSNPASRTKTLRKSALRQIFSFCEPQRCFEKVVFQTFSKPRGGVAST